MRKYSIDLNKVGGPTTCTLCAKCKNRWLIYEIGVWEGVPKLYCENCANGQVSVDDSIGNSKLVSNERIALINCDNISNCHNRIRLPESQVNYCCECGNGSNYCDDCRNKYGAWCKKCFGPYPPRPNELIKQVKSRIQQTKPKVIEKTHTLYRFFNENNQLMYVGITMNIPQRMTDHRYTKPWWEEIVNITLQTYPSRKAVLEAETTAINMEFPMYNIRGNKSPRGTRRRG